jgi:hypothetical protein
VQSFDLSPPVALDTLLAAPATQAG